MNIYPSEFITLSQFTNLDNNDSCLPLAFVQYYFDRNEHELAVKPHGNSKKENKPFTRTQPSTMSLLKEEVKKKCPKKALRVVENVKGGLLRQVPAVNCQETGDRCII